MKKIVIADDDPDILKYLREIFKDKYEIFSAADQDTAIDLINNEHPYLVITDLHMPEPRNGEAVAKKSQELGIAVIVFSSLPENLSPSIAEKCVAVLNKRETTTQELLRTVEMLGI